MGVAVDGLCHPAQAFRGTNGVRSPVLPQQRSSCLLVVLFIIFQKNLSIPLYSAYHVYGILFSIIHPTHHLQGGDPYYDLPRQSTP